LAKFLSSGTVKLRFWYQNTKVKNKESITTFLTFHGSEQFSTRITAITGE